MKTLPGYHEAGIVARALTAAQRRELRKVLGAEALVERVAEAIALYKTGRLLIPSRPDPCARDTKPRDLHAALQKACLFLVESNDSLRTMLDWYIRLRLGGAVRLDDLETALFQLESAAYEANCGARHKGGRPRDTSPDLLYSFLDEIVRDSGKPYAATLAEVASIALTAGGCDRDEIEKIVERKRKAASRARRKNLPKK